jgi:putative transposase
LEVARTIRIEFPGAIYHVMSRGDRREAIFLEDSDRELFLSALEQARAKTGWRIHAYCLMGNHFHLVVETPEPNLVAGMKWLLGVYTNRFNRKHRLVGHLFAGRYKALVVSPESDYFRQVCDYVHLNPDRAKLLKGRQTLDTYKWSSWASYLTRKRPGWLTPQRLFLTLGITDTVSGRRTMGRRLEALRGRTLEAEKMLLRGWHVGDEAHRQDLLKQFEGKSRKSHAAVHRQQDARAQAENIVVEELNRRRWPSAELGRRKKSDKDKIEIARRLRKETIIPMEWIAQRLQMGTAGSLAVVLSIKKLRN